MLCTAALPGRALEPFTDSNELSPTSSPKLGTILEVGDCGTERLSNMPGVAF